MNEPLSRERIVDAARSMIEDEGLDALSLRRLAKSLDVTAPAFYAYVSDKDDLLRSVAEVEFGRLTERFDATEKNDPLERVRSFSRAYIDHALESPELFRTMFLFPPELSIGAATGRELPAATKAFETALGAAQGAIDHGLFPGFDVLRAALTLWTATHGAAVVILLGFGFDDATRQRLIDDVIDTVIAGLCAGTGPAD
jgi:AcrR family transcriptional regulator